MGMPIHWPVGALDVKALMIRLTRAGAAAFAEASVDVFASTHTCLPALCRFDGDEKVVINNGAAGMPNFATSTGV